MSLFRSQIDTLPAQSGITLGSTVRFTLPRDFPLEGIMIVAQPTVSAVAATIAPEGALSLIQRVRLTVNDGGASRDIVNADALSIVQRHLNYGGNLDTETMTTVSNAFSSATAKTLRVNHFLCPLSLEDPTKSHILANLPRYNNDPVLEIQIGTQAQIDTHATPTFAISALTIRVVTFKRFVTVPNWDFIDTEFATYSKDYTSDASNQRYDVPVPGWHFSIGMRMYSSATALGDITQANGLIRFGALNAFERVFQSLDLLALNYMSVDSDVSSTANGTQRSLVNTARFIDFITDASGNGVTNLDGLYNSNPFSSVGAGPQIVADIAGGSNKRIVYMHDRCYGNVPAYQLLAAK